MLHIIINNCCAVNIEHGLRFRVFAGVIVADNNAYFTLVLTILMIDTLPLGYTDRINALL